MARTLAFTVALASLAAISLAAPAFAQPRYSVKKLGPLPGDGGSSAAAINNASEVAGHSISQLAERPYRWSGGVMEALPVTGAGTSNFAYGINAGGQVVGHATFPGTASHGALWSRDDDGTWHVEDLGTLPGFIFSIAHGLADSGTRAVGYVDDADLTLFAIAWEYDPDAAPPWQIQPLGVLPGYYGSYAYGLNNSGVAAGASYYPGLAARATKWTRTDKGWQMEALPFLPGGLEHSLAYAVNDAGAVAGSAVARDGYLHAVIWSGGDVYDLGHYPGEDTFARAINASNHIVGETWGWRAILGRDGQVHDLNGLIPPDTGWNLRSATGINDQGQIVGEGHLGGFRHSYLLTPLVLDLSGPVPGDVSVPNTFSVAGPTDEYINLYYSFSAGEAALPGCTSLVLNLDGPQLLAVFPGATSITIELPEEFSGATVYFQAASSSGCAASNVVRHTFP